jgi:hypothetical protein
MPGRPKTANGKAIFLQQTSSCFLGLQKAVHTCTRQRKRPKVLWVNSPAKHVGDNVNHERQQDNEYKAGSQTLPTQFEFRNILGTCNASEIENYATVCVLPQI